MHNKYTVYPYDYCEEGFKKALNHFFSITKKNHARRFIAHPLLSASATHLYFTLWLAHFFSMARQALDGDLLRLHWLFNITTA